MLKLGRELESKKNLYLHCFLCYACFLLLLFLDECQTLKVLVFEIEFCVLVFVLVYNIAKRRKCECLELNIMV